MINFTDRLPQNPNRYDITKSDGTTETVTITRNDNPVAEGTPLNRANFMAVQGMENSKTTFNSDGSITETFGDGVLKTTFNSDGSITEKFTATDGKVITKTTKFLPDGSIQEVIS